MVEHDLLAGNTNLKNALQERFLYVDPLNYLQVKLLHRLREIEDDNVERMNERGSIACPIFMTINGMFPWFEKHGLMARVGALPHVT